MHRLSRRMDAAIKWPPHQVRSAEYWENPSIPSGYTYLLQFVAHDLVQSAISLSISGALGAGMADARRAPRRCGLKAFTAAARSDRRISMHRMRRTTTAAPSCGSAACAGRRRAGDRLSVPRLARPGPECHRDRCSIPGSRVARTEALIAIRETTTRRYSQLTALFALLHNGLIDPSAAAKPTAGPNDRFGAAYKRFLCVRECLTRSITTFCATI